MNAASGETTCVPRIRRCYFPFHGVSNQASIEISPGQERDREGIATC